MPDASAACRHAFLTDQVATGARVVSDGWAVDGGLEKLGYTHEPRSQRAARARGEDPGELLPPSTGSPH
ncbi:MAG: transposase [Phycicoccus sp.]|nr:transposase [Phycicoccus sp.]